MHIHLYKNDLPDHLTWTKNVAVDTETMGLLPHRDRLCVIQLSNGDGHCHLVKFEKDQYHQAKNIKKLLADSTITKIFHYARFDVTVLYHYLGVLTEPIYCTKIAAKLTRTYADKHSLKDLCRDFLSVELSKQEQLSDWGADTLTPEQLKYAATDVLYLHNLKEKLDYLLKRENRLKIAEACFKFLPYRAKLDLLTCDSFDIFQH
ncbi:MAG: ribonuclease D [Proteobacteria bacterium]|nr:ribonuclease D [Pseudomonadota bacterium]